jgi:hypothetical protein
MAESLYDWSRFVVRVNVAAPANAVYEPWATKAGMENWLSRLSEFKSADGRLRLDNEKVEKEDHYKWLWHGWPDETVEEGVMLDCNDPDSF